MSVQDLDGTVAYSKHCTVTQDNKFEFPNRSHEQSEVEIYQCLMMIIITIDHHHDHHHHQVEIYECMISQWDEHDTFDSDQLPFFIEMFSLHHKKRKYVGLDLRLQYIEFMEARYSTVQYSTVQYTTVQYSTSSSWRPGSASRICTTAASPGRRS